MPSDQLFKVLLKRGEFLDEARPHDGVSDSAAGRVVPYKIYYPVEHGLERLPVILWSHGFGGNRDGASFISRHLAGRGYVVVHMTHFGTDSSLWEGKDGHPWDILQKAEISRETTLHRFKDVPFVLGALERWAAADGEAIGRYMDFEALGMSGHSFGAMTTQMMAGMMFPHADGALHSYHEARFKAGVLYSPVPIAHLSDAAPEALYGSIAMPLLHMTGTKDDSPLHDFGHEERLVIQEHAGHGGQYVQILEGGDHMVYTGSRGKLGANPDRALHEAQILEAVSMFWDAHLKGDAAAMDWLNTHCRA